MDARSQAETDKPAIGFGCMRANVPSQSANYFVRAHLVVCYSEHFKGDVKAYFEIVNGFWERFLMKYVVFADFGAD
jgi:hypothetical protein